MEYEYHLHNADGLKHALPANGIALRMQTIPVGNPQFRRFRLVHEAFGAASGIPVLVNTSFNGAYRVLAS